MNMRVPRGLTRRTVDPPQVDGALAGALLLSGGIVVTGMLLASVLFGWSPSPVSWYLARASGLILYLLTWFNLLTGLGLTTRLLNAAGGRVVVYSVHAYAFHLWYGFLTLHVLSLAIDPTEAFGARALLVPFVSGVREPWTGLGVIAAELSLVVGVSFGVRRLVGYRAWRAMHWLTFPIFAMALAHGFGAGTDSASRPAQILYGATTAVLVCLVSYRVFTRNHRRSPRATIPVSSPPYDPFGHAESPPRNR